MAHLKPCHLPILLALSIALLTTTDARHKKPLHTAVDFSKQIHYDEEDSNSTIQPLLSIFNEYHHQPGLGPTLAAIYELKLIELQFAVRHAKKMIDVIRELPPPTT
jgi:hypothetical protein